LVYGDKPNYDLIKVFGCLCFAQIRSGDKFASRSRRCILIGYPFGKKSWKLYDLENHEIFESRDVKFHEENLPSKDVFVGYNESNENYLKNMRYMDANFGGQGEFRTTAGQPIPQQLTEPLDHPDSPSNPTEQGSFQPLARTAPPGLGASPGPLITGLSSRRTPFEPSSNGGFDTVDPSNSSCPPET